MIASKKSSALLTLPLLFSLFSCSSHYKGTIHFELNGGSFTSASFTTTLTGTSGKAIDDALWPKARKEGYYFVGWREKDGSGHYREVYKQNVSENGKNIKAYVYPIGSDTLYAYFEPLAQAKFHLNAKEATILSPENTDADDFDRETMLLDGYVNKPLSRDDFPTASSPIRTFSYWYTEYPLKAVKEGEGKTTSYVLDKSNGKKETKFDLRVFPKDPEGKPVDFYAKWIDNPTVTMKFNLPGVADYSYTLKNNDTLTLNDIVRQGIQERLNTDYALSDEDQKTYQLLYKDKKLRGIYLDEDFDSLLNLKTKIQSDMTLYFDWADKIKVTFDYDGGEVKGKENTLEAYAGDILSTDILAEYTPTKEGANFLDYKLGKKVYQFGTDELPSHDVTLKAEYTLDPILSLKYHYPEGMEKLEGVADIRKPIESTSAIETELADFRKAVPTSADNAYSTGRFYTINSKKQKEDFLATKMPDHNVTVYLEILAHSYTTYAIVDEKGKELVADSYHAYYGSKDSIKESDFGDTTTQEHISYEYYVPSMNDIYIMDGIYSDISLKSEYRLHETRYGLDSAERTLSKIYYRKATKAITLTVMEKDALNVDHVRDSIHVLPDGDYASIKDYVSDTFGKDSYLTATDRSGKERRLSTKLPSTDTIVYLHR